MVPNFNCGLSGNTINMYRPIWMFPYPEVESLISVVSQKGIIMLTHFTFLLMLLLVIDNCIILPTSTRICI